MGFCVGYFTWDGKDMGHRMGNRPSIPQPSMLLGI